MAYSFKAGIYSWGSFLERLSNLSGPKGNSLNYAPLAVKSCSFYVSDMRTGKTTAKFKGLTRVLLEDRKGLRSPEKFRDIRETGSWGPFLESPETFRVT